MNKSLIIGIITLISINCFSQTFNIQRLDSLFEILEKKDKFMGSITVSQNGKLLYSKAIGYSDIETSKKATTQTKYRIGSISKMFTAVLVLKAIEENKLSLNKTIHQYFPQIENSKKITIANLLNHSSGIYDFTNDEAYTGYNTKAKSEKEMLELITQGGSDFEPSSKREYSNSNYVLLSYILEKVYKKDYATILNKKIIKPLDLPNTYFGSKTILENNESFSYRFKDKWNKETETNMSIPMGAGAIISNPTDLTTFIEYLFAGKIISDQSLTVMKTTNETFGMGIFEYNYSEHKSYGHTGGIDGFKSALEYFPQEKLAIALISNGTIYTNHDILSCTRSSYFNTPFEIPTFESIQVDSTILDFYSGEYTSPQIPLKITITNNKKQLFAQANGQSAFGLEATTATVFRFEKAGIVLEFNKNEMILKQGGKEFIFTKQ